MLGYLFGATLFLVLVTVAGFVFDYYQKKKKDKRRRN